MFRSFTNSPADQGDSSLGSTIKLGVNKAVYNLDYINGTSTANKGFTWSGQTVDGSRKLTGYKTVERATNGVVSIVSSEAVIIELLEKSNVEFTEVVANVTDSVSIEKDLYHQLYHRTSLLACCLTIASISGLYLRN
jgi:hypothetical protein